MGGLLLEVNPARTPATAPSVAEESALFNRSLHESLPKVVYAKGNFLHLADGREILDATGGAAVASIGHGDARVLEAMVAQMHNFSYAHMVQYTSDPAEQLAQLLRKSTGGIMSKVFFLSSGSEAVDAALKLARQYFLEMQPAQPQRVRFISRRQSYHGNTLGALGVSGHVARRKLFEPMLGQNFSRVSNCDVYHGLRTGETEAAYVARLARELDEEFQRVGPDTVCAFVAEPVVGATNGCVPAPRGYFQAMKAVCEKYGALLLLDEVMSGMGRCGTLHAWQGDDIGVAPDIQTVGKGLGGGYAPIAAVLANKTLVDVFKQGSGAYCHAQTYQAHPVACAAALEVQRIIRDENLMHNVQIMGRLLQSELKERLGQHPYVGNIRGKGLFVGIEFVQDKKTKKPFDPSLGVGLGLHQRALDPVFSLALYQGGGTVDGIRGDHVLLAPAYNVTRDDIFDIVERTVAVIQDYFATAPALEFISASL